MRGSLHAVEFIEGFDEPLGNAQIVHFDFVGHLIPAYGQLAGKAQHGGNFRGTSGLAWNGDYCEFILDLFGQ